MNQSTLSTSQKMNSNAKDAGCSRALDRQTHFVAGVLLVVSLSLATFVSWKWIYLALLPTFGLMLDATTGVCPMTLILKRMPWNRAQTSLR